LGDAVLIELLKECPAAQARKEEAMKAATAVQVYLVVASEEYRPEVLKIAQELRGAGWRVGFPLGAEKVGRQFGAAEAAGASHAVVVGAEWPLLKVKRLADRHEETVPRPSLATWLATTR
jgi:histidyl-tRNA synthetase